jgi:uncharacterized protein YyaL (SSP411 family)
MYLMERGLWPERTARAAAAERRRLWDRLDGGFFNLLDPSREEADYLETSKLLEANAWISAWQAEAGRQQAEARRIARLGWFYLRETLWDREAGGFWQAQVADNRYYALPPAERLRASAPPLDRAKRADSNAQAAAALVRMGRETGNAEMDDYAARTLDFILAHMVRDGRLYHIRRDDRLAVPDLPQDLFWLLAAAAEIETTRPDADRRRRLAPLAERAAQWLQERMRGAAQELPVELAGLVAWVAGMRDVYPAIPETARAWALAQLRIEPETAPDELILGLRAWEALLAPSENVRE